MGRALQLYDETRIDHFRGFAGYWAVDGKETTAMSGAWVKGPGLDLFKAMKVGSGSTLGSSNIYITVVVCPEAHSWFI